MGFEIHSQRSSCLQSNAWYLSSCIQTKYLVITEDLKMASTATAKKTYEWLLKHFNLVSADAELLAAYD